MSTFSPVPERPDLPKEEEKILQHWRKINAFQESLKQSHGKKPFTFYDGPPFATGLPHYGHILAGTIKDVVTRYAHQTGHHVERVFGWDCHGLPVEHEVDTRLQIHTHEDVLKIGIANYNETCRSTVMRYANEWKHIVERMGRWIDFEKCYQTMDFQYMETVWWCTKKLFDKNLIYRAFKVMPYSLACGTPLSNFEANSNYKDVCDPSIIVTFPFVDDPTVELLAWTTTPWTLPSNLALCVNPSLKYVKVLHKPSQRKWICCASRLPWICKELKLTLGEQVEILEELTASDFSGKNYVPLFPYFTKDSTNDQFKVLSDDYVTDDTGTGIVHCAPAFGEDDYRVCLHEKVIEKGGALPCPVDTNGIFTEDVKDLCGTHIFKSQKIIKTKLQANSRLIHYGDLVHSYPHCWRSDTPLIYRAVPCWFLKVEGDLRDKIIENNQLTNWIPSSIKEKRFHNWLLQARDWCFSRNRFWGTPIPIWVSEDFSQVHCIGSVAELKPYSTKQITDIHRHFIDDIEIPDPRGSAFPPMRRVPEVFDCWFESGSMPYSKYHYPFENADKFLSQFPADFIAEGLDQTRGWFYTLMVLSTALFDKPAFKNLIVNGLVLASDGKKMSKRLKNFPDPMEVVCKYGADALRIYLINSPVVRADPLRFKEDGVRAVVKDVILPWFHANRFFIQESMRYTMLFDCPFKPKVLAQSSSNIMDQWIVSATEKLVEFVRQEITHYRLYTVAPRLLNFLNDLTNWYVRCNRDRMKCNSGREDGENALSTLFYVLFTTSILMSPVAPFTCEMFYQNLKKGFAKDDYRFQDSVHYLMIPEPSKQFFAPEIECRIARMQEVVIMARNLREKRKVSLKFPVKCLTIMHTSQAYLDDIAQVEEYIREEVNMLSLKLCLNQTSLSYYAVPNYRILGTKLGSRMKSISKKICELSDAQLRQFELSGKCLIDDIELTSEDVVIQTKFSDVESKDVECASSGSLCILIDFSSDKTLEHAALSREMINRIQRIRKKLGLVVTDVVDIWIEFTCRPDNEKDAILQLLGGTTHDPNAQVQTPFWKSISENVKLPIGPIAWKSCYSVKIHEELIAINDQIKLNLVVTRPSVFLNDEELSKISGSDLELLKKIILTFDPKKLKKHCDDHYGSYSIIFKNNPLELCLGKHFATNISDAFWIKKVIEKQV